LDFEIVPIRLPVPAVLIFLPGNSCPQKRAVYNFDLPDTPSGEIGFHVDSTGESAYPGTAGKQAGHASIRSQIGVPMAKYLVPVHD
jgi:hypothetical protein